MRLGLLLGLLFWAAVAIAFTLTCSKRADGAPFFGTTLAWVEVIYPNVVTLLWTNPPDLDLAEIRLFAQRVGETDSIPLPTFYGRRDLDSDPYRLPPGRPESTWVTLPCITGEPEDWRFWLFSADTAGNVSARSNITSWRQEPN